MAGWGTGSFENEDAQSFLGRLNSMGVDDLRSTLARAADQDDYLEAPESSSAVAAAEVVAALVVAATFVATKFDAAKFAAEEKDASSPTMPRELADWIRQNHAGVTPDLVELARRAVERVRTNSELKDLWLEADGLNEWSAALRELKERLSP
ncbi:MAG TPA: DUF4259 domain-containing protein [Terriglobales bacterium]|nr:DUF4259 domain-containing protein [Terriglobales bacterium]